MKKYLTLLLVAFLNCQTQENKILDDSNLRVITSLNNMNYEVIYEFNELENLYEGIYIAVVQPTEECYDKIVSNIKSSNSIISIDNKRYSFVKWKLTPLQDKNVLGLFNYDSSLSKETYSILNEIKSDVSVFGNYFCYIYEKDNSDNLSLYVLDTKNKQIKIYQTYF